MSAPATPRPVRRIAMIGSGLMGTQIGSLAAAAGYEVALYDMAPAAVERALCRAGDEFLPAIVASGMLGERTPTVAAARSRLRAASDLADAVAGADMVIEAVREEIETKRAVFAELSRLAPDAILATNSSSFPSRRIADVVARPERLLNMHFFAPIWLRTMLELMTCGATDDAAFAAAREVGETMGLFVAQVQGESHGFIINRIWRAIKRESLRVVDDGHATPEEVDEMFLRFFFGAQRAPFETMDMVGLDVIADIEATYHAISKDPTDRPITALIDKVAAGKLGEKTGEGFYVHPRTR